MNTVDSILHARWIIPADACNSVLDAHCIVTHKGQILDILPTADVNRKYQAAYEAHYDDHALLPGFINTHTHAAMSLFRGLADDLPLMDWLQNHIWPAESKWVDEAFAKAGTELAIAEMIRCGTTCFNDMYFYPEITGHVANNAGMRACLGLIVLDFPTVWANNSAEYIEKGLEVHDKFKEFDLIQTMFAPHAPYTVSDEPLEKIRTLSDEMEIGVHMHIHETLDEVNESVKKIGKRPLARLNELGLINPDLLAVHMTQLEEDEIEMIASRGVNVVHCPKSNLKLASGFCPVKKLIDAGVTVTLGTDGAASNNSLNIMSEMQTAALLSKGVAADPSCLPAYDTIKMVTIHAARALGIDSFTGSLEKGKSADIVAIDFNALETQPVYDPVAHIVYCCNKEQIKDVWVAGKQLLKNGTLTTLDEERIIRDSRRWNEKINHQ